MLSAARHNELVRFIMDESDGFSSRKELENALMSRFGDVTFDDLDKALLDAADRERERAREFEADAEVLMEFLPLFEGEPKGALIGEIAIRKAAAGDPLAIKFLSMCGDPDE